MNKPIGKEKIKKVKVTVYRRRKCLTCGAGSNIQEMTLKVNSYK